MTEPTISRSLRMQASVAMTTKAGDLQCFEHFIVEILELPLTGDLFRALGLAGVTDLWDLSMLAASDVERLMVPGINADDIPQKLDLFHKRMLMMAPPFLDSVDVGNHASFLGLTSKHWNDYNHENRRAAIEQMPVVVSTKPKEHLSSSTL